MTAGRCPGPRARHWPTAATRQPRRPVRRQLARNTRPRRAGGQPVRRSATLPAANRRLNPNRSLRCRRAQERSSRGARPYRASAAPTSATRAFPRPLRSAAGEWRRNRNTRGRRGHPRNERRQPRLRSTGCRRRFRTRARRPWQGLRKRERLQRDLRRPVDLAGKPERPQRGARLGHEPGGREAVAERAPAQSPRGVLHSDNHASLNPGYWVAFSGQYTSTDEAGRAAERLRGQGFAGAYPRQVSDEEP
jgi:hypothetical protein